MNSASSSILNYTSRNRASLIISELPNTTFTIQNFKIPSVSLPSVQQPTYLLNYPHAGDRLIYESLDLTFQVSEDLLNYIEVYDWLRGLGCPFSREEFKDKKLNQVDATVTLYSNSNNPLLHFTFVGCVPTFLSSLEYGEDELQTEIIKANLRLEFAYYTITKI